MLLAGCGSSGVPPRRDLAVTGRLDLPKPAAGQPDAGTAAGHGNDGGVASTGVAVVSFTGTVRPPDSTITVSDGVVRVEPSGRFTVAIRSPRRGAKDVRIEATKSGHRPWRTTARVVRTEPGRVRVPERDMVAPTAALLFQPGHGGAATLEVSPSFANDPPDMVRLHEPAFSVTAAVRDAEGGTGRIRLAMYSTIRCGGTSRSRVRILPPAQIENVALPPGAWAPIERQRSARFRLDAGPACSVRGDVLAEGTDAHGRQAVTHHVGFRYP